jgi:integrase
VGKPTILPKTINRYLSSIGSFAGWLLSNDFLETDVMAGMYLNIDRDKRTRIPFTNNQLKLIFASPLFDSCAGAKREHELGSVKVRDWRYWIPWIGLYTGARLGEIAQLLTTDVRILHEAWIFHVTREGAGNKSTKTPGSQRVVPMHRKLICCTLRVSDQGVGRGLGNDGCHGVHSQRPHCGRGQGRRTVR